MVSRRVSQVPVDSKDVIIGQIHGADDIRSVPFVMLHDRDGEIRVVVKQKQSGCGPAGAAPEKPRRLVGRCGCWRSCHARGATSGC